MGCSGGWGAWDGGSERAGASCLRTPLVYQTTLSYLTNNTSARPVRRLPLPHLAEQRQRRVDAHGAAPADGAAGEGVAAVRVLVVLARDVHGVAARVLARHVPAGGAVGRRCRARGRCGGARGAAAAPSAGAYSSPRGSTHIALCPRRAQPPPRAAGRPGLTRGRRTAGCPCAGPPCGTRSRGGSPPPPRSPPPQSGPATPPGAPCARGRRGGVGEGTCCTPCTAVRHLAMPDGCAPACRRGDSHPTAHDTPAAQAASFPVPASPSPPCSPRQPAVPPRQPAHLTNSLNLTLPRKQMPWLSLRAWLGRSAAAASARTCRGERQQVGAGSMGGRQRSSPGAGPATLLRCPPSGPHAPGCPAAPAAATPGVNGGLPAAW